MKMKEESEKASLKLNIKKIKIMTSGPITSSKLIGKQWKDWENSDILYFWGVSKITADGD